MRKNVNTKYMGYAAALLFATSVVGMVLSTAALVISDIQFSRNYVGHLKRAGDAVSLELAEKELTTAVAYLEAHNLHTVAGRARGCVDDSTNILYSTPANQISFHVDNVTASLVEVREVLANKSATPLEKSNVLIKLRESLLDNSDAGHSVTCPAGLAIFPHNLGVPLTFILSFIGVFISTAWLKLNE